MTMPSRLFNLLVRRRPSTAPLSLGPGASPASDIVRKLNHAARRIRTGQTNVPTSSTVLNRHSLPVSALPSEAVHAAGFVPSYVAVPERGQSSMRTYRHPYNNLHLHQHRDQWLLHEDEHPAVSMVIKKWRQENPTAPIKELLGSIPPLLYAGVAHGVVEGIPGYLTYLRGLALGERAFDLPGTAGGGGSSPAVQVARGLATSAAVGGVAAGIARKTGIAVPVAAAVATALASSRGAAEAHQFLTDKGVLEGAPMPTVLSAALQMASPVLGAGMGWAASRAGGAAGAALGGDTPGARGVGAVVGGVAGALVPTAAALALGAVNRRRARPAYIEEGDTVPGPPPLTKGLTPYTAPAAASLALSRLNRKPTEVAPTAGTLA